MSKSRFSKVTEQIAAHLRAGLCRRGLRPDEMPGCHEVAADFRVSPQTAQAARPMETNIDQADGVIVKSDQTGRTRYTPEYTRGSRHF